MSLVIVWMIWIVVFCESVMLVGWWLNITRLVIF